MASSVAVGGISISLFNCLIKLIYRIKNLFLVPSHIRLDKAEQQLTPEMFKESRLFKAIKNLDYDFIVIDCRPTLGTLTVNALFACNFIIVPCESARYSLDGFSDLMDTVENVKNNEDVDKEKYIRILLTKYDARKSVSNEWVERQLESYKNMLFETKIRQKGVLQPVIIRKDSQDTIWLVAGERRRRAAQPGKNPGYYHYRQPGGNFLD